MKKIVFIIFIGLLFSCIKEIEITKEYISNENWDDKSNNSILIQKMLVIDNSLNIFDPDFVMEPNHWNIVNKLELDSSFVSSYWGLNTSDKDRPKLKGKVYFDKNNGWNWYVNGIKKPTIGNLRNNTWYKFSELTMNTAYYKYVYVDSNGKTHVFSVNLANF